MIDKQLIFESIGIVVITEMVSTTISLIYNAKLNFVFNLSLLILLNVLNIKRKGLI